MQLSPTWHRHPGPSLDPQAMAEASPQVRELCGYGVVSMGFEQPWRHAREDVARLAVGAAREIADMRSEVRPEGATR